MTAQDRRDELRCAIDEALQDASLGLAPHVEYDPREMLAYRAGYLPVGKSVGKWRIEAHVLTDADPVVESLRKRGHDIPTEQIYCFLYRGEGRGPENLWMCDTPPEVASMLPAIRRLEDATRPVRRVLIGGLGMGVIASVALSQPHVERVDVIERDPDVTRLVRPHIRAARGRLRVHGGDALRFLPAGEWDYAYYDIWRDVSASNCADFSTIRQLLGDRAAEVEFWHREWSESLLRHDTEKGVASDEYLNLYERIAGGGER